MSTPKTSSVPAKNSTPNKSAARNATAKATKLLRGLDNQSAAVLKYVDAQVAKMKGTVSTVLAQLNTVSSAALSTPPVAKPAAAKTAAPKAVKAKPAASAAKATKPVRGSTTGAKAEPAGAKKPAAKKPAAKAAAGGKKNTGTIDNRPNLKPIIMAELKARGPLRAAELYHKAEAVASAGGFKVWSNQSLYSLLDKAVEHGEVVKTGEKAAATFAINPKSTSSVSDQDAEALVEKVHSDAATSAVV